ncbi:MAG TPA: hypothetical protein VEH04_16000 [Verrucomicrobiae bacterium]|nr:hypothetical protein [Verrucomicrobiae bacterium]
MKPELNLHAPVDNDIGSLTDGGLLRIVSRPFSIEAAKRTRFGSFASVFRARRFSARPATARIHFTHHIANHSDAAAARRRKPM